VERNAKSYDLKRIQTDGERLIFAEQLTENNNFKEPVIRHAERRSDNWGNDVSFRAHSAPSDLHAADAHYYKDCMSKFFSNNPTAFSQTECD